MYCVGWRCRNGSRFIADMTTLLENRLRGDWVIHVIPSPSSGYTYNRHGRRGCRPSVFLHAGTARVRLKLPSAGTGHHITPRYDIIILLLVWHNSFALIPLPRPDFPAELARCRAELLSRRIVQEARRSDVAEARENCRSRRALYSTQLVSAMSMGKPLRRFCRAFIFCWPFSVWASLQPVGVMDRHTHERKAQAHKNMYFLGCFTTFAVLCQVPTLSSFFAIGVYLLVFTAPRADDLSRSSIP